MTDQDFQQWRALSEKASPGPWRHVQTLNAAGEIHCDIVRVGPQQTTLAHDGDGGDADFYERDAAFIAAAREAVPALIAEVERLRLLTDPVALAKAAMATVEAAIDPYFVTEGRIVNRAWTIARAVTPGKAHLLPTDWHPELDLSLDAFDTMACGLRILEDREDKARSEHRCFASVVKHEKHDDLLVRLSQENAGLIAEVKRLSKRIAAVADAACAGETA